MNKKLKTMVTITIKETSKQAKAVIEMLKTFDFVDFDNNDSKKQSIDISTRKATSIAEKAYLKKLHLAVPEIKSLSSGKRKGQSLKSFLDEL